MTGRQDAELTAILVGGMAASAVIVHRFMGPVTVVHEQPQFPFFKLQPAPRQRIVTEPLKHPWTPGDAFFSPPPLGYPLPNQHGGGSGRGDGGSGDGPGPGGNASGHVAVGSYNTKHGTALKDIPTLIGKVDILGLQEARSKGKLWAAHLRQHGWGYYQPASTDTSIAWNANRYTLVKKGAQRIEGTLWGGHKMHNSVPYVLLRDKVSGREFYVMDAHTQVHGYKGGAQHRVMVKQYAAIHRLYDRLEKSGKPVILTGDLNNPHAQASGIVPGHTNLVESSFDHQPGHRHKGLDYIFYTRARVVGHGELRGTGFGHSYHGQSDVRSDHPFIYALFDLLTGR